VPNEAAPEANSKRDIDPSFESLVHFLEEQIPFNRLLGIRARHLHPGTCVLVLPWSDDLIGDPTRPAVHGGVLSTLIDTAGGAACFSMLTSRSDRVSTVDLRVDYLRPAPAADLMCTAQVVRMGNKVAVTRMEVRSSMGAQTLEEAPALATGTAVYNVVRRDD
jgi:uncharacterized protein (TIGR00369 family)